MRPGDLREKGLGPSGMGGYRHKEAYCLMKYQSQDGLYTEFLWNSRDGVTPFGVSHPNDRSIQLFHINWHQDKCIPDYVPVIGSRVLVDLTADRLREYVRNRVNAWWNHPEYPMCKQFPDKARAEQELFHGEWRKGMPDIVVVDEALQGKFMIESRPK